MSLILCGFKNSGKTTAAKALAARNGWQVVDTDDLIAARYQERTGEALSIPEIFKGLGEGDFRALEREVILELEPSEARVIATGGGAVVDDDLRRHLRSLGTVVYLQLKRDILFGRMMRARRLPAFIDAYNPRRCFNQYFTARAKIYHKAADLIMDVSGKEKSEIALELQKVGTRNGQ